jgi:hypothetical protein
MLVPTRRDVKLPQNDDPCAARRGTPWTPVRRGVPHSPEASLNDARNLDGAPRQSLGDTAADTERAGRVEVCADTRRSEAALQRRAR